MREVDLLIVGGGPSGVGAAQQLAARGVRALLVDERPRDQLTALDSLPAGTDVLTGHSAWGVFPAEPTGMTVGIFDGSRTFLVRAQELVLATGAVDVDLAFRGADLPGVVGGLELLRGTVAARRM